MLQRIAVKDLKEGMYIVDISHDYPREHVEGHAVYSVAGYVFSSKEVEEILRQGFTSAYVDTDEALMLSETEISVQHEDAATLAEADVMHSPADAPPACTTPFHEELGKAAEVREHGLGIARRLFEYVNNNKELPLGEVKCCMDSMVNSVARNANALFTLAKLRNRDNYTFTHSVNVAMLAVALGKQLNVRDEYLSQLGMAGFFHDIGKLFVPSQVLHFPGKLSPDQLKEVQDHVVRGQRYLRGQTGLPQIVLDGELDHQERFGGGGYPGAKVGMKISFAGRLLAVADVYDALSSQRCYKAAMPPSRALAIMYQTREKDFSPGFVEALVKLLGVYPPGSLVQLSNQTFSVVLETNESLPLRPRIVPLLDKKLKRMRPCILDLAHNETLSVVEAVPQLPVEVDIAAAIEAAKNTL